MARPKKSETNTTSVVEETVQEQEKTTEVETNTPVETETTETVEESKPVEETVQEQEKTEKPETKKEPKKFGDNEKVVIKCNALAGKKLSLPTRSVEFDENGKCEVTGAEANRLLSIPGYELAK